MDKLEKFIGNIAESQAFEPDDGLTKIVRKYGTNELDEQYLDEISAAHSNEERYKELLRRLKERK